jgi:two-component system, sensor histidine kinase and response regulator
MMFFPGESATGEAPAGGGTDAGAALSGRQIPVKCLIVDDLEENRVALSALLRQADVELLTASSGIEALELLLVHDVALALLDVQMPEMDGFELAELIRGSERTRDIPLIFVTAGSHDQRRLFKGYETGAVDFIFKPIEPHILKSKAEVFFQLYRQKQIIARELEQRTETLRLNEMFVAVLGHDLRTPLSAIITSAHILQRTDEPAIVRKVADQLMQSGQRMNRMIEDILDLARARLAGGIPLERGRVDLVQLLQKTIDECRSAHPDCEFRFSHAGDSGGDWDGDRLAQVATNLIGNAVQHGTRGEPIDIRFDGTQPGAVVLAVSNAGSIPEAALPHIFDPFRGSQERPLRNDGLGLGLFIVQQVVQAHRGRIDVQSEGGSTCFRVAIPRELAESIQF